MKWLTAILAIGSTVSGPALAQGADPIGDQFQVNSYTSGDQGYYGSDVAVADDGSFIVVWKSDGSYGSDTSDSSIQGQRIGPDGSPQGSEFQVNNYTTSKQQYPVVSVGDEGEFIVVWESSRSNGSDPSLSILGQRFDVAGNLLGTDFQVNSYTFLGQIMPAVATGPGGEFVVVWSSRGSYGSDTSYYSIQGQRFSANGSPRGGEFQINSSAYGSQWEPAVAVSHSGDFVVVCSSFSSGGDDSSGLSIQGQRFSANGAPQGSEFQVNSYTTGWQNRPDVAISRSGDIFVVWESNGSSDTDDSGLSVQGQRYSADGVPQGSEFQINSWMTGNQMSPSIDAGGVDSFFVAWQSAGSSDTDDSGNSIQGQRFTVDGQALGNEFQVNSYTTGAQWGAKLSANTVGDFVVTWVSDGSGSTDTDGSSVQGQFLSVSILADGFESRDLSGWTGGVP